MNFQERFLKTWVEFSKSPECTDEKSHYEHAWEHAYLFLVCFDGLSSHEARSYLSRF